MKSEGKAAIDLCVCLCADWEFHEERWGGDGHWL